MSNKTEKLKEDLKSLETFVGKFCEIAINSQFSCLESGVYDVVDIGHNGHACHLVINVKGARLELPIMAVDSIRIKSNNKNVKSFTDLIGQFLAISLNVGAHFYPVKLTAIYENNNSIMLAFDDNQIVPLSSITALKIIDDPNSH